MAAKIGRRRGMTMIDLGAIVIEAGSHATAAEGACVMEWVSIFAGLPFDASPVCTDSVVAAYARALNDVLPDDQRQRLVPFIPRLALTANGGCPPEKRALVCADVAVRVFAPAALRSAGLEEWAGKLAGLPEITDGTAARDAARVATRAAASAAFEARAARAVTRDAAGAATRSAASAARAAEVAAEVAAGAAEAARAAARSAGAARVAAPARADEIWEEAIGLLDRLIELH